MTQQVINVGAAINDGTGDPARTAFTKSNDNFTELYARGSLTAPQGRLTLVSGTPVMTTTTAAATVVYYTPYLGQMVPIWSGTAFVMTDIGGELSQATTDTTKSPAAVATGGIYDFFVWDDAGTKRCTRGPVWSNSGQGTSARGTGAGTTELERLNGILVNKNAIANGPAARCGTYVGTAKADIIAANFIWKYGSSGTATQYAQLFVWNMYNRVRVATFVGSATTSWTYATASFRLANNDTGNQILIVLGLSENTVEATAYHYGYVSAANAVLSTGIGLDSPTVSSAAVTRADVAVAGAAVAQPIAEYAGVPSIGYHSFLWLEQGGTNAAFNGGISAGMLLKFFA